jgi:hypothetical protein
MTYDIPKTPEAAEARIVALVHEIERVRTTGGDEGPMNDEIAAIKAVYGNRHITGVGGDTGPPPQAHYFDR